MVSKGELDGTQAFLQGKIRTEGDFGLFMKIGGLFKK